MFSEVLAAVGAKGSAEILEQLRSGRRRPSELTKSSGVSEPTAYSRLKSLHDAGVIEACIIRENGRTHKGYRLTDAGEELVKLFSGGTA